MRIRRTDLLGTALIVTGAIAPGVVGSITSDFRSRWYRGLRKPAWQPPGAAIGAVWTVLYAATALSGSLLWRRREEGSRGAAIWVLFALQSVLNGAYTPILTRRRDLRLATVDSALLCLTVATMATMAWPRRRLAGALLAPYVAWTVFATFLSATIVRLNR
jgi:translocator protein